MEKIQPEMNRDERGWPVATHPWNHRTERQMLIILFILASKAFS